MKNQFNIVARCERCGRFMKRGLVFWANHVLNECPVTSKPLVLGDKIRYVDPITPKKMLDFWD